jgi:hypothetical protein
MSIAAGSGPINDAQLNSILDQLNKMNNASCDQIIMILKQHLPGVQDLIQSVIKQISSLGPWAALANAPSINPAKIVKWIKSLITSLITPQLKAAISYAIALAKLAIKIIKIIVAVAKLAPKIIKCVTATIAKLTNIQNLISKVLGPALQKIAQMKARILKIESEIKNIKVNVIDSFKKEIQANISNVAITNTITLPNFGTKVSAPPPAPKPDITLGTVDTSNLQLPNFS